MSRHEEEAPAVAPVTRLPEADLAAVEVDEDVDLDLLEALDLLRNRRREGAGKASPSPAEIDAEVQRAWERLRARSRLTAEAHRSVAVTPRATEAVASWLATPSDEAHGRPAPTPPPGLGDPIVQNALDQLGQLQAHARRTREAGPDTRAASPRPAAAPTAHRDEAPGGAARPSASPPAPVRLEQVPTPRAGRADREADQLSARSFCARLAGQAAAFRSRIGPDREIGVRLSPVFGEPLYVDEIGYEGADMIVLTGSTKLGVQVQVVQHVAQANVWFVAMSPRKAGVPAVDPLRG